MNWVTKIQLVALITLSIGLAACGSRDSVILATTTSVHDTGLLDILVPVFEKKTGYSVKAIAVGSGQAMAMGERGEADVLLVHSPDSEIKFMKAGFGRSRRTIMQNDFAIVGPPGDAAGIRGMKSPVAAFKKISDSGSIFISRGDNSGTHVLEQKLWKAAGANPEKEKWYQQTGLGMGQSLSIANEKLGYALTDRSTYLAFKGKVDLVPLVEGDRSLKNIYRVIVVNAGKTGGKNEKGSMAFADFLLSKEAQDIIGKFGIDKYGSPLFHPHADAGEK